MPDTQIQVTRSQLAEFLPNARTIKAFEQLFLATGTTIPLDLTILTRTVEENTIDVGAASSKAELALSILSGIGNSLDMLAMAPDNSTIALGLLDKLQAQVDMLASAPDNSTLALGLLDKLQVQLDMLAAAPANAMDLNPVFDTLRVIRALTITVPTNVAAAIPTVASAGTIAVTTPIAFVSGVAAIANITAPASLTNGGQITLIPTGLFTTTAAGNIALASVAVVSKALIMTYSAATVKWYPSY